MRLFSLVCFLLFSIPSQAIQVVKIISQDPSGARTMVGSGIALDGSPFLITSDHVFFHSNQGYLHQTLGGGHLGTTDLGPYLAADWGKGLGLFKWSGSTSDRSADTGICKEEHPQATQFLGVPSASNETVSIAATFSERISAEDYFVQNGFLDVYQGGLAEFGMSGGAVVDPDHHCLAGIISHQRKNAAGEMETLVIPASEMRSWYERRLLSYHQQLEKADSYSVKYTDLGVTFFEEVSSQLGPQKSIVMGDIRFYLYPIPHASGGPQMLDVMATVDDRSHPGETLVTPMSSILHFEAYTKDYEQKLQNQLKQAGVRSIAVARDIIQTLPRVVSPPSIWMVPLHQRMTPQDYDDGLGKMEKLKTQFKVNCSYQVPKERREILRVKGWQVNGSSNLRALETPGLVRFFRDMQKPGFEAVTEFPEQSVTSP
ncbi:MAG: hypothetical protein H7333_01915 [Bdellovibrionales bacterium]|nr:hypothetical protein [Oligoflexia bacterium]